MTKLVLLILTIGATAVAKPAPRAVAKPANAVAAKAVPAGKPAAVRAMTRALASAGAPAKVGDPLRNDPNKALEVRGQSRTLSMMLVLKNGKESINFIKVRDNYRPEITSTPY